MAATYAGDSSVTCNNDASMLSDVFPKEVNRSNAFEDSSVQTGSCIHNNCFLPFHLTLLFFDDNIKVNAVSHLRQLDEYCKSKGIQEHVKLSIATRLIKRVGSRFWSVTV
jgi:hypothetical protein